MFEASGRRKLSRYTHTNTYVFIAWQWINFHFEEKQQNIWLNIYFIHVCMASHLDTTLFYVYYIKHIKLLEPDFACS